MSQPNPHRDEPQPDVPRPPEQGRHSRPEPDATPAGAASAAAASSPVAPSPGAPSGADVTTPAPAVPPHAERTVPAPAVPPHAAPAHAAPTSAVPAVAPPAGSRETPAEVTTELPPVPAAGDVPLLDLLAPRDPGASPYTVAHEPYVPVAGDYQPVSGTYTSWDDRGVAAEPGYAAPAPHAAYPPAAGHQPAPPHAAYPPPAGPRRAAGPRRRPPARPRTAGGRRRPVGAGVLAGMAAGVLLLGVVAVWALTSGGDPGDGEQAGGSGGPATSAPRTSTVLVADGYQFTQAATRNDTDCVGNSYGKVSDFFRERPCTAVDRALYTTTAGGRPAVVSVSVVRMPDATGATELQKLADTSGTGNVADLLRAGVTVPGGPSALSSAGYASELDGTTVVIAEADFADPAIDDDATLEQLSRAALQLRP